MSKTLSHLLKTKRFLPLFLTQFWGAFNDNSFRNALIILIGYKIAQTASYEQFMIALTAGIFILPFFIFSATAGQLADKFEKSLLIKIIKVFEIFLMSVAALGFFQLNMFLLLLTLFLIGTHSAFFGPLKYAILPEQLKTNELIGGNALIEAGTFIAILTGTIFGGIFILMNHGTSLISTALLSAAIMGFISSLFIPKTIPAQPQLKINWNIFKETWRILQYSKENRKIFLSILGISWFWLVGVTFLTQFPIFTKNILHANASVVTFFLTLFSLGIAFGSLICNKLLKGEISAKYVPISIFAMSVFIIDLVLASTGTKPAIHDLHQFLNSFNNIRIALDILLLSVCGGIFIVPLYSIIQHESSEQHRARVIASNNILNALFMVMSTVGVMFLYAIKFQVTGIFICIALINILVAFYACKLLPHTVIQSFVKWLLKGLYKVKVQGLEHYAQAGERVVIVANHTSFLDAVLLAAFLPDPLIFAINTEVAKKWWMKLILKFIDAYLMNPANPLAIKTLIKIVKTNKRCVIFPEGRITVTGSLMKIYEGPGMIADQADATLLPIRIDGAQYTPFSKLRHKVRQRWFPEITLTIEAPCKFSLPHSHGRERRQIIGKQLYDIMTNLIFKSSNYHKTLFDSLLEAKKIHGRNHLIIEDTDRQPLSYQKLITRSFILGEKIQQRLSDQAIVGILLPNLVANVVGFFALQAYHRVPAMLNYTTGIANILNACRSCGIKEIMTSKRFITALELQGVINKLESENIHIIYLEELTQEITLLDKIRGYCRSLMAKRTYKNNSPTLPKPKDPAVVLFTSGSEGTPKAVLLSHSNLQANRFQLSARIDFTSQDIIFNALPMFHSFGLSTATILPILSGIKTILYPSPLHYRIVPELIYEYDATIIFGTDTFLRNYAKNANPYDFYSLRYVLAGAEKLREKTRKIWIEKFGIRILEGYGSTETSPVISCNTAMQYKEGTVGRILPGIETRLETILGIAQGGRLFVRGPNIMLGYMTIEKPLQLQKLKDEWYDTGDIVSIDKEGYLTILGRAKRFAKIAGEMISLSAIENLLADLWPNHHHAIISVLDENKGEQLVLLTTRVDATRDEIITFAKKHGVSEIAIPKKIIHVDQLPLLSTGKVDYQAVEKNYIRSLDKIQDF